MVRTLLKEGVLHEPREHSGSAVHDAGREGRMMHTLKGRSTP